MGNCPYCGEVHNVGFVATRLAGTDGVSLEADKWAEVFQQEGFHCYFLAGELDTPPAHSYLVPEAHFHHPQIVDIYPHADLVTCPSNFEGFGNAFLEAVYFRKPIVVNTYSIYQMDIRPKGFEVIEIDGYVTDETIRQTLAVIDNPARTRAMVDRNYEIATKCFSYLALRRKLTNLIYDSMACWV